MTIEEKEGIEKIIEDLGNLRERKADLEIRKETLEIWKNALASTRDEDIDELFDNTPDMIVRLVSKIELSQDKEIFIHYRFKELEKSNPLS